jgi:hypothetical protein
MQTQDNIRTEGTITAVGGIVVSPTGGVTPINQRPAITNRDITVNTTGTDTTPASGTQYITSLYVPENFTITNVNWLIGGTGGTNRVYAVVYNSAGAVLRTTDLTSGGTIVGTAATMQSLPLTSPLTVRGPQRIFIGISINGNTARIRTIPAHTQNGVIGASQAQTHGTVVAITPPTTFTADQVPFVFIN